MIFNFFLDFLFPKFCLNCGGYNSEFICPGCFAKIKKIKFETCPVCGGNSLLGFTHPGCCGKYRLDGMTVGANYRDPIIQKIIHRFKYQGKTAVAAELVEKLIIEKIQKTKINLLTFIPLHPDKERKRGFNQSEIIACEIGKKLNIPVVNLLKRTVYNLPQMSLKDKDKRRENVKGIFKWDKHGGLSLQLQNMRIGLVDDVATTGATISEAAWVLKHHGISFVWGVVLARGQRD